MASVLPYSAGGWADNTISEISTDESDGNRTRIVNRSKYLDTVKDALMSDKLKSIPVDAKLYKGFSGMRDPTRPTKMTVLESVRSEQADAEAEAEAEDKYNESSSSLALTSTIVSPGRRTAIINGKTVSKGDKINGAVILRILPLSVKIKKDNKVTVLDMSSGSIKKPTR
jgi:hypothetical protein